MNDVNLNNMSNDDILDLYNKTKEYIAKKKVFEDKYNLKIIEK